MTQAEIRRRRCVRCRKPGYSTWQICALGDGRRVLCRDCDVALNRVVLRWSGAANWRQLAQRYKDTFDD